MRKTLILLLTGVIVSFQSNAENDRAILPTLSGEKPDASAIWSAWGGRTTFRFDPGLLQNYRMRLDDTRSSGDADVEGGIGFRVLPLGTLEVWAPKAAFDGFRAGSLVHEGGFVLATPTGQVSLQNFSLRPSSDQSGTLEIVSSNGMVVFTADHIHALLSIEDQTLSLWNMDLRISRETATALDYPELEGNYLGQAFTKAGLNIPVNADLRGACTSPNWHDGVTFQTDVALVDIGSVGQQFRQDGIGVVVAPSATLQNVGTADVPWIRKFNTPVGGTYPEPLWP